jgi:hypothetical protein
MVLVTVAANGSARAQDLAGVDLEWRGPPGCAEPLDTLALAHGLVDPSWRADEAMMVRVDVRDLGRGALELSFETPRPAGPLRRTLQVMSCSEARRAAAVWIALSVGEQEPTQSAQAPGGVTQDPDQKPVGVAAVPAAAVTEPKPNPEAEPVPVAAPEADTPPAEPEASDAATPTTFARNGLSLALAVGVEGPVLHSLGVPFAAWLGWRETQLELDLGVSVWWPATDEVNGVEVRVEQLAGVLGACYWISFGRWELGPSAKLLIERVAAELNGQDAQSQAWVRAALGARLAVWAASHFALQLVADANVSLNRPTLSTSAGDSVQTTAFNVAALAALVWTP